MECHGNKEVVGASRGVLPILLSLVLLNGVLCVREDETEEVERTPRDLSNSTSSFIYNVVPEDPDATVSPEYSTAINTFSIRLLYHVYRDSQFVDRNLVLSPFSVSRCLAVLTEGASGTSKRELLDALGGQVALDDAREALAELLYADNSVILQCADALWVDSSRYEPKQTFRQTANEKYGVEYRGLDFGNKMEAIGAVNGWIQANTNGYLTDIVKADAIQPTTVLLLTNAVYFEADWASPFDITKTAREPFHAPGADVSVEMMTSGYMHETRKTATYESARLYYGTEGADYFYLDVYMPTAGTVEAFLENDCLPALSSNDSTRHGALKMPKFMFSSDVDLKPMLKQLGVNEVFDPFCTDLAGIVQQADGGEDVPIYVSRVRHVAGIETDEEGTTAYAVTIIAGEAMAAGPGSPNVVLDRPFVYFIRAGQNGLILFAGVVNNPNMG